MPWGSDCCFAGGMWGVRGLAPPHRMVGHDLLSHCQRFWPSILLLCRSSHSAGLVRVLYVAAAKDPVVRDWGWAVEHVLSGVTLL